VHQLQAMPNIFGSNDMKIISFLAKHLWRQKKLQKQGARVSRSETYFFVGRSDAK